MADRDPTEDSLFREIDEELRQENLAKLWKKYGHLLIGLAVALVLVVAGYQGWRYFERQARHDDSAAFSRAMTLVQEDKPTEALAALNSLAEDADTGYGLLARFRQAALLARQGDAAGAAATYGRIAEDTGTPELYRDLATLLSVLHRMDDGDPRALMDELAPLLAEGNPWRPSARELTAALAYQAGDTERARELFKQLGQSETAPQGVRQRAQEFLAALGEPS